MSLDPARNVVPLRKPCAARGVLQGVDPSILRRIGDAGTAVAIWQRKPLPAFLDWINAVPAANLPRLRTFVAMGAVEECVHAACDVAGTPDGPMRAMFASDVAALAFILSEVTGDPLQHLQLDPLSTDGCRRFHVDNMTLRLLCAYRGRGTQMAPSGSTASPTEVATGAAVLLRGARWPGPERIGLLHRSPPIESSGETRLIAVIDPAADHADDDL